MIYVYVNHVHPDCHRPVAISWIVDKQENARWTADVARSVPEIETSLRSMSLAASEHCTTKFALTDA